ncbi:hypothetical protein B0T20DRAFT_481241 [Sordaria brevicollis]|uniref:Uncharacterized protein n=1 Tax=Sordaria brevicollis TaxID=83679 RepID=A0AAE0PAB2_SORBR|nr:hypothetical protein B0T20DRAFT_481241 [Sordaria brevicollis]
MRKVKGCGTLCSYTSGILVASSPPPWKMKCPAARPWPLGVEGEYQRPPACDQSPIATVSHTRQVLDRLLSHWHLKEVTDAVHTSQDKRVSAKLLPIFRVVAVAVAAAVAAVVVVVVVAIVV